MAWALPVPLSLRTAQTGADSSFQPMARRAHLSSQVDACKHDVLGIVVEDTEAEVCPLQEGERCRPDFLWEMQGLANALNFDSIVLQELFLFFQRHSFDLTCRGIAPVSQCYGFMSQKMIEGIQFTSGRCILAFAERSRAASIQCTCLLHLYLTSAVLYLNSCRVDCPA